MNYGKLKKEMRHHSERELLQPSRSSFVALFLLLVSFLLYSIAFYSNEWFIINPSHYGIWSVTFCDVLTCQSIPTVFNDQPGWYFFVQLFNVVGLMLTIFSLVTLFTTICISNLACSIKTISTFCKIGVCSMVAGMTIFFVSLTQESQMSLPSVSWSVSLASLSGILQVSALIILLH